MNHEAHGWCEPLKKVAFMDTIQPCRNIFASMITATDRSMATSNGANDN